VCFKISGSLLAIEVDYSSLRVAISRPLSPIYNSTRVYKVDFQLHVKRCVGKECSNEAASFSHRPWLQKGLILKKMRDRRPSRRCQG
jgi:hypothetical protein